MVQVFLVESIIPSYNALQVARHCRGFGRNCTSVQHSIALLEVLQLAVLCISILCEKCIPAGNVLEDFAFAFYFTA